MKFDIITLESAVPGAKASFSIDKLPEYKKRFIEAIQGADEIVLTGAGPAWLHLALWHEAHGRVSDGKISFEAPAISYVPTAAGVASGDGTAIQNGKVIVDISKFEVADPATGRVNLDFKKVNEYQCRALGMVPAFQPGEALPEFEVILTGAGPIWLFLALCAALHSRGGAVVYSAPNAPRVVIIDHK